MSALKLRKEKERIVEASIERSLERSESFLTPRLGDRIRTPIRLASSSGSDIGHYKASLNMSMDDTAVSTEDGESINIQITAVEPHETEGDDVDHAGNVQRSWRALLDTKDAASYNVGALGRFTEYVPVSHLLMHFAFVFRRYLLQLILRSNTHMGTLFGHRALVEQRGLARAVDFIARMASGGSDMDGLPALFDSKLGEVGPFIPFCN